MARVVGAVLGLTLAAGLLLGAAPAPALADDGSVSFIGGSIYPLATSDIRMEAETVQAVCYWGFAEYRVDFKFLNEGDAQTVLLGFPFASSQHEPGIVAFRAFQDGRPLEVTWGQGDDPLQPGEGLNYYLHQATFRHGETMITINYVQQPTADPGTRFGPGAPAAAGPWGHPASYMYWLHTGAPWKGTIGKAVVQYRLADDFVGWSVDVKEADVALSDAGVTSRPETYVKIDDRTFRWVFEDLEPTPADDVTLAYTAPPTFGDVRLPAFALTAVKDCNASGRLDEGVDLPAGWQAFDGSPQSAWGVPAPGAGSWLQADIPGSLDLQEIRILPGNNRTLETFREYARPKTVKVVLSSGASTVLTLGDSPSLQKFAIKGSAEWVRFDVLDVYPGSKSSDMYIAEIDLGTEPAPDFKAFAELVAVPVPSRTSPTSSGWSTTTVSATSTSGLASTSSPAASAQSSAPVASSQSPAGSDASTAAQPERALWPLILALVIAAVGLMVLILVAVDANTRRRTPEGE